MRINKFGYKITKEAILDVIVNLELEHEVESGSFCAGVYHQNLSELKKDINKIEKVLKNDYNIDLFKFMNDNKDEVFDDYEFSTHGALLDTILYLVDDKKGILSGNKLIDSEDEDYVFKYQYGFYNYDMGKRYILQSFDTLEDYYKSTAEKIMFSFFDTSYGCDDPEELKKSYIIKDVKVGHIIFCDLRSVYMILDIKVRYSRKYLLDCDVFVKEIERDFGGEKVINDGVLEVYIGVDENILSDYENEKIYNKLFELEEKVKDEWEFKRNIKNFNV